ncbi:flavin monoamine oxidase family protein [Collimonas silvisoli]|uniref:flavin monoamine oxidase family protein n=1 Tax=Collimonas silvisoli TaxID=2825884 RepID=UPI001B8CEC45|nr:NAD(P)/FAD-dependent oxidoreductase [Collimonas silvisoli]
MADEKIDIAIVGGGVSGVYSAWRLKQANPKQKIVVFEGSDHIGGRLLSVTPPGIPDMVAELGGMRILPKVQPLISTLIDRLNKLLPDSEQITLYPFPVDKPQNIAYLRGTYLRLSDFTTNPDEVPYRLGFPNHGQTAGSIMINAIEQIVPGITNPDLTEDQRREMAQQASFSGKRLYQQGFWNVLMRVINGESYQFSMDAGGYDSTMCNWNAADAIPWYLSDFGVQPVYKGFTKGFQEVPRTLAKLFIKAGGEVRLNSSVSALDSLDGAVEFQVDGKSIRANSVILAMPRRSLDLLADSSPILQEISGLISSVTPRPLFKLFTTYASPWWRAAGYSKPDGSVVPVEAGRSVTDIPVRQTYYWPKSNGAPVKTGPAMLLASYDDGDNTGFWDGLRPQRHQFKARGQSVAKVNEPFVAENRKQNQELTWDQYQAPYRMVTEVARQLATMHGLSYTPKVQDACFRDWGDDPFGGGWNSWNIGVKSWEVKQKIIQPIGRQPLYICGEAYSDAQGWVEGALQTADMMLEKFGLEKLKNP